ncbi:MAG: hypothetical protein AAF790_04305 [Planctomycetota bacterium]
MRWPLITTIASRWPLITTIASAMLTTAWAGVGAATPLAEPPAEAAAVAQQPPAASDGKAAEVETFTLLLAEGALKVEAPKAWEKIKPRSRIVEAELSVKPEQKEAAEGGPINVTAARLTVMASGGGVQRNLNRWVGQFRQISTESGKAEITEAEVNGMKLTIFDAAGTYIDSPRGPMGPKTPRPDYRMVAGILQTDGLGDYYFKLVGPAGLVGDNAEAFIAMLKTAERTE